MVLSALAPLLRAVTDALRPDIRFALIGGLAVSVRTEPRFTRDIDLAVAVSGDLQAEAVVARVVPPFRLIATVEHEQLDRLAAVRLSAGHGSTEGAVVDLLFASSAIEGEVAAEAEVLEVLPGISVPVATVGHLIALKLLAHGPDRPQDQVDLAALLPAADGVERARAYAAVQLIIERGAARGRDLAGDLDRALADA